MARDNSKKSFLDFFKVKDLDEDEFDEDLFDDDDDEEEEYVPRSRRKSARSERQDEQPKQAPVRRQDSSSQTSAKQAQYRASSQPGYSQQQRPQYRPQATGNGKLVDFNNQRQRTESYRGKSEVYVIKPQEISESQTVTDFLKNGKTIVINMEGLELAPAQRIIDFIGGACYALNGSLQAISANIFIAAPESIEVSGDLREEILNSSTVSPQLGKY